MPTLPFRDKWKSNIPLTYDWFLNHHLVWPSLSCRWGPVVEEHPHFCKQHIYMSEQTDGSVPNTLIVATVLVPRRHVAPPAALAQFEDDGASSHVRAHLAVRHPGEVNRIRALPRVPHLAATHTDGPEVFLWNLATQPDRTNAPAGSPDSIPDLVLAGHTENAEFALATSALGPRVLSGGRDKCVALWDLEDHVTSLSSQKAEETAKGSELRRNGQKATTVQARTLFKGHRDTVEDVQFSPTSLHEFCSVADDSCLILWDSRTGDRPVLKLERAHSSDVHTVDWSPHNAHHLLTGAADASVKLIDRRRMGMAMHAHAASGDKPVLHAFKGHTEAVVCVQWSPDKAGVFGSCADDGLVNIWDVTAVTSKQPHGSRAPPGLLFQHLGHREKVSEFQWNPLNPWTVISSSIDSGRVGGGTLQVWRVSDLVYLSEGEARAELQRMKAMAAGKEPPTAVGPPLEEEAKKAEEEEEEGDEGEDRTEGTAGENMEEREEEEEDEAEERTEGRAGENMEEKEEVEEEAMEEGMDEVGDCDTEDRAKVGIGGVEGDGEGEGEGEEQQQGSVSSGGEHMERSAEQETELVEEGHTEQVSMEEEAERLTEKDTEQASPKEDMELPTERITEQSRGENMEQVSMGEKMEVCSTEKDSEPLREGNEELTPTDEDMEQVEDETTELPSTRVDMEQPKEEDTELPSKEEHMEQPSTEKETDGLNEETVEMPSTEKDMEPTMEGSTEPPSTEKATE